MSSVTPETNSEQQPITRPGWWWRLTVADGLLALIGVAAAVLRLAALGQVPLSPQEAENALAAWQFWQPEGITVAVNSPAYFSLTSLITQVLGYSDAVVRLIPALFGLAIVLLPWFLRNRLGYVGALTLSLLLAVSPMQTIAARTAGGDAIALFALALMVVAFLRYQETRERPWYYVLFAGLGLGLASSPLFYSGLVSLAVAWLLQATVGPPLFGPGYYLAWPGRATLRTAAVFSGGVLVVVSTLFLWYPAGLGAVARLPADWLAQFSLQGDLQRWLDPFLALGRYELVLILLGIVAALWATLRNQALATFNVYWIIGIFILILLQRGYMPNALLATLPGYLTLGIFVSATLAKRVNVMAWGLAGGLILIGVLIFVNVARFIRVVNFNPQQLTNVWLALFAFAFAAATVYFVATWDVRAAYQGTLLAILALFVFYNWGTGWWLGHYTANDPHERWVTAGTDDDVRLLVDVVREISRQTINSSFELDIFSTVDTPVLHWYLRDFSNFQVGETLPIAAQNSAIISPAQAELTLGSDYLGSDYGLIRTRLQPQGAGSPTPLYDSLRWWLFHEATAVIDEERVILWLRADLTR